MSDFLFVINPATGEFIQEIKIDDSVAVATKASQARKAQPAWAARPLSARIDLLARFKDLLVQQVDRLAATLTTETGKPITQAKNEILAIPQRIDFFTQNAARLIALTWCTPSPQMQPLKTPPSKKSLPMIRWV